jgi:hypothetical protein
MSTSDILLLCLVAGVLLFALDRKYGRGRSDENQPPEKRDS